MRMTQEAGELLQETLRLAARNGHEYVMPEHLLYLLTYHFLFQKAFEYRGGDVDLLREQLGDFLIRSLETSKEEKEPRFTEGMRALLLTAQEKAKTGGRQETDVIHLVYALFRQPESFGVYYMRAQGVECVDLIAQMTALYGEEASEAIGETGLEVCEEDEVEEEAEESEDDMTSFPDKSIAKKAGTTVTENGFREVDCPHKSKDGKKQPKWQRYALCLNDMTETMNPLIGREEELERTIQILCRKEKNNPLHIGEPGVGKTAVTYGLARRLKEGEVPEALKGGRVFSLDLSGMLAGTQYRGDFEKRFREIMDGIAKEDKPIVYIDEIHNIVGAGAVNGGSLDVSNLLKPYLVQGHIRFIGATTYTEYKKHFEKSRGLARRFQNVVIEEPGEEDTVRILEGLKESYEQYHGVVYEEGVLAYAVRVSIRYMNERFLPDKAIDLMDEAGAYRQLHPLAQQAQTVDRALIDRILTSICHVPQEDAGEDETEKLATLEDRMNAQIFGQQEAVSQAVNAVKFSRAGLLDEGKPEASLLFVGPTGVGKTEVARTLAKELGVALVRFDMSEYGEKHAVAKLIGAPAGYVGYEEGGLLTEAIRKNPYCVLLLDEIEKAHGDIYNLLLQVMDYATLTDNQGRKADFRNVILIMTSNAGADRLSRGQIGFGRGGMRTDGMMDEVKRIFQPEFRNRLNRIVIFRGMDERMADQIVRKKLGELAAKLEARQVEFRYTDEAAAFVKTEGISLEYGAREIQRVIDNQVKPLLADALLFGTLKNGGSCCLDVADGALKADMRLKGRDKADNTGLSGRLV